MIRNTRLKLKRAPVPACDCVATQSQANRHTSYNDQFIKMLRRQLAEVELDVHHSDRIAAGECCACFYIRTSNKIVGHAFTDRVCDHCGCIQTFSNTDTRQICSDCSRKYELCRNCTGDLHGRERVELQPPRKRSEQAAWWARQREIESERIERVRAPKVDF